MKQAAKQNWTHLMEHPVIIHNLSNSQHYINYQMKLHVVMMWNATVWNSLSYLCNAAPATVYRSSIQYRKHHANYTVVPTYCMWLQKLLNSLFIYKLSLCKVLHIHHNQLWKYNEIIRIKSETVTSPAASQRIEESGARVAC